MRPLFRIAIILLFTFTRIVQAQTDKLLQEYFRSQLISKEWLESDISDWVVTDTYKDKSTGLEHVYVQQRHEGILVYNALSIFLIRDGKVLHANPGIIDHLEKRVNATSPVISAEQAIIFSLAHLEYPQSNNIRLLRKEDSAHKYYFDVPDVSLTPVEVQLVYVPNGSKVLLAWNVSMDMLADEHWWNVRVDAVTGSYIEKNDYTRNCEFDVRESSAAESDEDLGQHSFLPPPASSAYNVFPLPIEAPTFGSRTLLSDPFDPAYSPYGWHDTDGNNGAEYTITRGNNVYAYEDQNNDDQPGYSPDGTSDLNFDFPYTPYGVPANNMDASLTNLFYCCNRIHDYLYPLGFDEASGNFQQMNYTAVGLGGDYVKAEGFDGSGTNNANFATPPDGSSGRMQMYLWDGNAASCSDLSISSSTFTGSMAVGYAEFSAIGSVTANVILVNDGSGAVTDACSAIINSVAGKIALIDRGTCSFVSKAQAAQAAGAVGVIIANNTGGAPPNMSGTPMLSIPCVSVSQSNGNLLKTALLSGTVNATITTCSGNDIDASFDNGVIAHEYGHGISNRLTGGPSHAGCLENAEQGGEGWSDFFALMLTIEPGDAGADPRGIGTYSLAETPDGAGIRRYPYSTNQGISPLTYGDIPLSTGVHAIGEIWCNALWDMSWLLIDQFGFSDDPTNGSAGNNLAIRLVMEGMKLQPCGPGFLDSRDAILLADAVLYNNAHRCLIWQAFAGRGMGFSASQGSANVAGDEIENFDMPAYCFPPTSIPTASFSSDFSSVLCGGNVQFSDESDQAFEWYWTFGDGTFSNLQNPKHTFTAPGTYNVQLLVTNPLGSDSIIQTIDVTPAFSVTASTSNDSICVGKEVSLSASASGSVYKTYSVEPVPYAPIPGTGTLVSLGDDQISTSRSIGFTFNFFGQNYTSFYVSSNGFITFSPGMPATPVYGEAIPFEAAPNNIFAIAWNDLNPLNPGSSIRYFTTGTAPNRMLVINYNTSHYGGTGFPFVAQGILYEGSNVLEIHTTTVSDVSSYDEAATTTQGVENADGSDGVAIPGRNGAIFSASNDAYRFTPYTPYSFNWLPGNLDGPLQLEQPETSTAYSVQISDGTPCIVVENTPVYVDTNCVNYKLKLFIEGFYTGSGTMVPALSNQFVPGATSQETDTIEVELRAGGNPATVLASTKAVLMTDGSAECNLENVTPLESCWIVIKHRNGLQTWSASAVTLGSGHYYDFSSAASQAFGSNMKDVYGEGIWSIYSGDINQDEFIDIFDFPDFDLDNQNFIFGVYIETDLNGDGFVDIFDFPIFDQNNQNFIFSVHP